MYTFIYTKIKEKVPYITIIYKNTSYVQINVNNT